MGNPDSLTLRPQLLRAVKQVKCISSSMWKNLTVEPVILFYLMSVGLNQVTRPNLLLQKACITKLGYSQDFCDDVIYHAGNKTALTQLQKGIFHEMHFILASKDFNKSNSRQLRVP